MSEDTWKTMGMEFYTIQIHGYDVVCTGLWAPEQYDVFLDGEQVGYLRLRFAHFTARVPDAGGEIVYEKHFEEDPFQAGFEDDEQRETELAAAVKAIQQSLADGPRKS